MNLPLPSFVDERFLHHRLRSTSLAGIAGATLALGLFLWRYYHDHRISGDLLAVGATFVAVKLGAMIWFRFKD